MTTKPGGQKALEQVREQLRTLSRAVEQSASMVIITDARGIIEYVNPRFTEVTGYTPDEAIGEHTRLLKSGESSPEEYAQLWETIVAGREWRGEFHNRKRNGDLYWAQASISPIRDEADAITHYLAIEEDVTDSKRTQDALRESEELLQGLLRNLPEGVCLLNDERHPVMSNSRAREYLQVLAAGASRETIGALGNRTLDEVLVPRADGLPHEVVVDGPPRRIYEIQARPITRGETEGWCALVVRDVTQEREIQEKIAQQERLASVGQLAAGIAHDFNNLLTVMMGVAQLLELQEEVPDSVKESLGTITSQGDRAAQLIRQVLDFSRQSVVHRQPMNLVPFLKESVKLLERTLPETIELVPEFQSPALSVSANPSQLQQVVTNLVVNARDAMPDGGELRLELSSLEVKTGDSPPYHKMGPGNWAVLVVRDTGTGVPAEVIDRIYEPFFTTKPHGEGTGLGLAQVYGIVKQHGGYIDAESTPGRGTTFSIYLPLQEEAGPDPEPEQPEMHGGRDETILLVEDQKEVLDLLKTMLERMKYRVIPASDGVEALRAYDKNRDTVQLVLTDMVMPGMGGRELYEELRRRNPDIRVVVMTGYAPGKWGETQLPEGIAGLLEKPLAMSRVAKMVRKALNR